MEKARVSLQKEVDIVEMVRLKRYVHLALKHLLDTQLRKDLKARSQFYEVLVNEKLFNNEDLPTL